MPSASARSIPILVLGHQLSLKGTYLGEESIARCAYASDWFHTHRRASFLDATLLSFAGFHRYRDLAPLQRKTLSQMMLDCFQSHRVPLENIVVGARKDVWGSVAELEEARCYLQRSEGSFFRSDGCYPIFIVSSDYHLPRLRMLFDKIFAEEKKSWDPTFLGVPYKISPQERLKEWAKHFIQFSLIKLGLTFYYQKDI